MNKPIVNVGDLITLPATPGGAKVSPREWPTGFRARYGETARFYLAAGLPVKVVQVRDEEITVRHIPSGSTVILTIDDLSNPVLQGSGGDPFTCSVCSCPFTIDEWYARHNGHESDEDLHSDCCDRSGPCSERGES